MKIDQVLIHYLLRNKQLPLQGIGVFYLEGAVTENADPDKPIVIPSDAIRFEYNPRTAEDPDLVNYISETLGKIKPLASADLDSYLMLARQFLNIGKPLILPNIGTIEKTNSGELIYKSGQYVMERVSPNIKKNVDEADPSPDESFSDFPNQRRGNGRAVLYVILLIILGLIAWAVWRYAFDHKEVEQTMTSANIVPEDDSSATTGIASTSVPPVDTPALSKATDTSGFKIVIGEYSNLATAQRRLADLQKYRRNVVLYTADSVVFKIAEPFALALSDTTRILDSLRAYYGKTKPYHIER